jgi:hypothetical protein
MTRPLALLVCGLLLSIIGTATATDAVSLREVFHAVPVLGALVTGVRLGMGTSLAHAAEPVTAVLGFGVMLLAMRVSQARVLRARMPVRV